MLQGGHTSLANQFAPIASRTNHVKTDATFSQRGRKL